jgi:hypothetical protein
MLVARLRAAIGSGRLGELRAAFRERQSAA